MARVAKKPFYGSWRIVHTDMWRRDALDLVGPATITLDAQTASLSMIAIEAHLDVRFVRRDGKPAIEFSLCGYDEHEDICGRGWAILEADELRGHLYLHGADDSAFVCQRE